MGSNGFKELAKKEIRERISALLVFIAAITVTRVLIQYDSADVIAKGHVSYFQLHSACFWVIPFLAFYLGISTFLYEKSASTMTYLLTLPISKFQIYAMKTTVSAAYLIVALAILPAFINDSANIGYDRIAWSATEHLEAAIPLALLCFVPYCAGLIGSVLCDNFQRGAFIAGVLFAAPLLAFAKLELVEATTFLLVTGIGFFIISGYYLSPSRTIDSTKTLTKRFAIAILSYCVLTYVGLHGWNRVQSMIPGHYYGSFMKVNGGKTILSFNESGTFFWKYDTYRMCVENNTLIPLFHKRNYSFVAMSPDNQFIIMRNDANHWGFYSRENTLEIFDSKGSLVHSFGEGSYNPAWSKDSSNVAYIHATEHDYRAGGFEWWELRIFDVQKKTERAIPVKNLGNSYLPSPEWTDSDDSVQFTTSDEISLATETGQKSIDGNQVVNVSCDGKVTTRPASEEDEEYNEYKDLCSLPKGHSYGDLSKDKQWVSIRFMKKQNSDATNLNGPRPFNSYKKDVYQKTLFVAPTSTLPDKDDSVSEKNLKRYAIISFPVDRDWDVSRLYLNDCVWNEQEQAFMFFTPDSEGKTLLRYYYPKSKELKTILTVNDFVHMKHEPVKTDLSIIQHTGSVSNN